MNLIDIINFAAENNLHWRTDVTMHSDDCVGYVNHISVETIRSTGEQVISLHTDREAVEILT